MMTRRHFKPVLIAAAAAPLILSGPAFAQIGKVAAVNQRMDGTPPEATTRQLFIKDAVVTNERVQTSAAGSGQLLFIDHTSLTIAANSDVKLDRYVFDPDKQAGEVAISMTRGAIRFIGGAITKGSAATIRTPTATIGIRGGMAIVEHEGGQTKVTNVASVQVTVATYGDANGDGFDDGPGAGNDGGGGDGGGSETPPKSKVVLTRPGATSTSNEGGTTYSGTTTPGALSNVYGAFEGNGDGGFGGAPNSQQTGQGTQQVAGVNSGQPGGSSSNPVTTTGEATGGGQEETGGTDPTGSTQTVTSVAEDISDGLNGPLGIPPTEVTPMLVLGIESDIAMLTGVATYDGTASGTMTSTLGPMQTGGTAVSGTSRMTFDFTQRAGALELNLNIGTFVTGVDITPNGTGFSGSDPILGGPDSLSANGDFLSLVPGTPGPDFTAVGITGNFTLDLQTQNMRATGTFDGRQ